MVAAITKFDAKLEKDGMAQLYQTLLLVDEVSHSCYYGIDTYVNLDYNTLVAGGAIFQNILYNAGFMFTDVV